MTARADYGRLATVKPRIVLTYDQPNWSVHGDALVVAERLADEFEFLIVPTHSIPPSDWKNADLVVNFFYARQPELMQHYAPSTKLITRLTDNYTWRINPHFRAVLSKAVAVSDGVIFVNEKLASQVAPLLPVPPRRYVCQTGIDTKLWSYAPHKPEMVRYTVGWTGSTKHGKLKGLDEIRAACRQAGVQLSVVDCEERLRTQPEMLAWYRSIDLYVCWSFSEGAPGPLLEANACGVPWISTDVGHAPEILSTARGSELPGIILPRDSDVLVRTILDLRLDMSLRARMQLDGRVCAERDWDWTKLVERFRVAFRDVLTAEKPRRG